MFYKIDAHALTLFYSLQTIVIILLKTAFNAIPVLNVRYCLYFLFKDLPLL